MGLEPTISTSRVRRATHCAMLFWVVAFVFGCCFCFGLLLLFWVIALILGCCFCFGLLLLLCIACCLLDHLMAFSSFLESI